MKTIQQSYPRLAQALHVPEIYLKREDEHQYGSHKGRVIPLLIKEYKKRDGISNFVISSSGNAALAAAMAVSKHNQNNTDTLSLHVYVGQHVNAAKLKTLQSFAHKDANIVLNQVDKPKQMAFRMDATGKAKLLRQSTDDLALVGYAELAAELEKIPNICAIFVPTSSGTTAQALAAYFAEKNTAVQVHVVQTQACFPIAQALGATTTEKTDSSIADAIVDQVAHRKNACATAVRRTQGEGWIVSDEDIQSAKDLTKKTTGIDVSPNSALSVAGLKKAGDAGWYCNGAVVCLVTGA